MPRRSIALPLCCLILLLSACSEAQTPPKKSPPPAQKAMTRWVDSVYSRLGEEERIGQLFMVAAYSGGKNYNQPAIEKLVRAHQIGGLIFMQGGPARQAEQTNTYQRLAQVPLLMAMDAEWGLGMRLDSVVSFPKQMMIGATRDTALAYNLGMAVAFQCKRLGVHVNFAPVVDVNNNPANPVINARSFGENKYWVTRLGIAYMRGMQDFGVMACAKHFPGHGDVSVDSHKDLPVVNKSRAQLDTLELYPFRGLIAAGVQSVMVAHLAIPALETETHVPTTLSKNTVTGLLKEDMGFKGLVFTDALDMQGVAKYFPAGEADVRAFIAGNDVLLFSQDVPTAIAKIKAAVKSGKVSPKDLEGRVKKILAAKWSAGLAGWKPIDTRHIAEDINQYTAPLNAKIAEAAVTTVRQNGRLLPLKGSERVLYVVMNGSLGEGSAAGLQGLGKNVKVVTFDKGESASAMLRGLAGSYDAIIINVHGLNLYPAGNYGLSGEQVRFLEDACARPDVIALVMGNAYAVKYVCNAGTILAGYEDNEWTQAAMVRALKGDLKPRGILPVTPPCLK
jgi:beta-glucosidase-like glycosyl hydrolase